jgi:TonB family protein
MKKLILLFFILATFSCKHQSDKDRTDNSIKTTNQVDTSKTENQDYLAETTKNSLTAAIEQLNDKAIPQADNFIRFSNFYNQFNTPAQTFNFKANEDISITCKEGTKISVKSNSFVTKMGTLVKGEMRFQVTEFYKISDILLANLSTTSNDRILETGGMILLEAFSEGEKCELKDGATIKITFPTTDKKEDMQLFKGSWANDKINWTIDGTTIVPEIIDFPEVEAEFPGGAAKLEKWFTENFVYPQTAIEKGIQGKVYVEFIVNENGKLENIRILRGVDPLLDEAALSLVERMPKWTPAKQKGEYVKNRVMIPINFSFGGEDFITNNIEFKTEFEKNVNDDNLSKTKMNEVSQYLFSTSKLGWINCDRFYKDSSPKINYFVNIGNSKKVDIKVVFNNFNSILTGSVRNNTYTFDNVPIGKSVTLVALKYENSQYYLAIKKTKITKGGEPLLEFEPVTMARLKIEMEKLNHI